MRALNPFAKSEFSNETRERRVLKERRERREAGKKVKLDSPTFKAAAAAARREGEDSEEKKRAG